MPASGPEQIPRGRAIALSIAFLIPTLFIVIVLAIFSPVAGLAGLLAAVVVVGVMKNRNPQFVAALFPKKKPVEMNPVDPPRPNHSSSKRTYMMLVGINAMNQHRVTVNESPFIIGREADCSFRLDYPQVSRHHLEITYTPDDKLCYVTDQSSNGTYLNSKLIPKGFKTPLHQGDALQIAGVIFSVEYVHY